MSKDINEVLPDLNQFIGTERYIRHRILPGMAGLLLTDGANYVAENAGAWWLMDTILLRQYDWLLEGDGFVVVELDVADDNSARLQATDGDESSLHVEVIPFTDFPQPGIKFYLVEGETEPVLMLPGEY